MGADRSRMIRCPMNEVSLLWMLHALRAGIHHTAEGHCSSGFGHNTCRCTSSSGQRSSTSNLPAVTSLFCSVGWAQTTYQKGDRPLRPGDQAQSRLSQHVSIPLPKLVEPDHDERAVRVETTRHPTSKSPDTLTTVSTQSALRASRPAHQLREDPHALVFLSPAPPWSASERREGKRIHNLHALLLTCDH